MPNHVSNHLEITGPEKDLAAFIEGIGTDDEGKMEILYSFYPPPDDGGPFEWREKHWGTKWGDYETKIVSQDETKFVLDFLSAWTPPFEGIQHISKLFPTLTFEGSYDEPSFKFLGAYAFRNGEHIGAFHLGDDEYPEIDWSVASDPVIHSAWQEKVKDLLMKAQAFVHQS